MFGLCRRFQIPGLVFLWNQVDIIKKRLDRWDVHNKHNKPKQKKNYRKYSYKNLNQLCHTYYVTPQDACEFVLLLFQEQVLKSVLINITILSSTYLGSPCFNHALQQEAAQLDCLIPTTTPMTMAANTSPASTKEIIFARRDTRPITESNVPVPSSNHSGGKTNENKRITISVDLSHNGVPSLS